VYIVLFIEYLVMSRYQLVVGLFLYKSEMKT